MVHFNELYITDDGKNLVIDAEIDNLSMYRDCYIEKIEVDVADSCDGVGLFNGNQVTVFDFNRKVRVIGDLDGDGVVTKADVDVWNTLRALVNKKLYPENETDEPDIFQGDDGKYYYYYGTSSTQVKAISERELALYKEIAATYEDPIPISAHPGNMGGKLLGYIGSMIDDYMFAKMFGHERVNDNIYDLNDDNEAGIADINTFLSFMEFIMSSANQEVIIDDRGWHVHKCLDLQTLFAGLKTSPQERLYIVQVTVKPSFTAENAKALAEMGCGGWDNSVIQGYAFYGLPVYNNFLSLADSTGTDCESSLAPLADFALRYNAFDFALRMGDWCQAWYYLSNYLLNHNVGPKAGYNKGCGCHG